MPGSAGEAIVLIAHNKPAMVFTDVKIMRAWLRSKGPFTGRLYTQVRVPLDPEE